MAVSSASALKWSYTCEYSALFRTHGGDNRYVSYAIYLSNGAASRERCNMRSHIHRINKTNNSDEKASTTTLWNLGIVIDDDDLLLRVLVVYVDFDQLFSEYNRCKTC
jgi:hypothetical protein